MINEYERSSPFYPVQCDRFPCTPHPIALYTAPGNEVVPLINNSPIQRESVTTDRRIRADR
ncbi:MAG: hypothetical protein ACK5JU_04710 [Bacteroidales bacterium]